MAAMRGTQSEIDRALQEIYASHPGPIVEFVKKNGGSQDDAHDVFQDGVIALYRNVRLEKFRGESKIGTYLYSICRFIWYKKARKIVKQDTIEDLKELPGSEDPWIQISTDELSEKVADLLAQIGEDCRKVLHYTIFDQHSMEETAKLMDYKNAQIARNKKSRCLSKLKNILLERPEQAKVLRSLLNDS